jgi:CHAT domain-containing protein/tetratricopeptide (TPR) repeat protein
MLPFSRVWVLPAVLLGLLAPQDLEQQLQEARASGDRPLEVQALLGMAREVRDTRPGEALALVEELTEIGLGSVSEGKYTTDVRDTILDATALRVDLLLEDPARRNEAVQWALDLATDYRTLRRTPEGVRLVERMLSTTPLVDPPDAELEGRFVLEAVFLYELSGRLEEARAAYERARALPLEDVYEIAALEHLAMVLLHQGRLVSARPLVAELRQRLSGAARRAEHVITLASLHMRLGELEAARELLEDAVERLQLPTQWRERVNARLTLSAILIELGEHARAEAVLAEALAVVEPRQDAQYEQLGVLQNIAFTLIDGGRPDESLPYIDRAGAVARDLDVAFYDALVKQARAAACVELGEPERALELSLEAREIFEAVPSWEYVSSSLEAIARASIDLGDFDEAQRAIAEGERILDAHGAELETPLATARFRSRFEGWYETTQALTAARLEVEERSEEAIEFGFLASGRWKGRMLLEGIVETRGASPTEAAPVHALAAGDRALIEFAPSRERLYAYVLSTGGVELVDLGPRTALEDQVEEYLDLFARGEPKGDARRVGALGSALHRSLLAPALAKLPTDVRDLVFVPTAELAGLPMEALVVENGAVEGAPRFEDLVYLGDRYAVTYAPSTPVLARLAALEAPPPAETHALILADPAYRGERRVASRGPADELERIPRSRDEAVQLAQLLVRATSDDAQRLFELLELTSERDGSVSGTGFDLFVGADATVDRLRGDLAGYTMIHCAVHGIVDAEEPAESGLALSWEPETGGLIDLATIRNLELEASLVVLSACETARGEVLRGEGIQSVAQAFLEAGSRAVVASLWRVHDDEATRTMQVFYRGMLDQGLSAGEALQTAKRALRNEATRGRPIRDGRTADPSGHPYYWAPFIYIGAE